MEKVFALWHERTDETGCDHEKMLGVYSTEQKAREAMEFLRDKPGFKDYPEGFYIRHCTIDRTEMVEGFVTVYPGDG